MSHSHAHPHAHDLGLLIGGVDLFAALIEAVDAAHHEVHLETYIFRFEGAGADVAHALMRAAQRGVQVHGLLTAPRLDYAVSLRGPLVAAVRDTMTQLWSRIEAVRELRSQDLSGALDALRGTDQRLRSPMRGETQLVLRDNVLHRTHIERTYRKAIGEARQDIVVASAYFFPGRRLRRGLVLAAQRGVRVRLLLQGQYEYFLPYRAARQLYGQLMAAGVEIYEYHASFLHAKVAVVDGKWLTVGSSNLDPFSLLLAREANVVAHDPQLARTLHTCLMEAIERGATRVDAQTYLDRGRWQRIVDALASAVLRFGVFLTGKRY